MTAALSLVPDEPEELTLCPVLAFWVPDDELPMAAAERRRLERAHRNRPQTDDERRMLAAARWRNPLRTRIVRGGGDLLSWRAPARRGPVRAPAARPKRVPARQVPQASPAPAGGPIRPAALRVVPPRRQRPGARPRSLGAKPLTVVERQQLRQDEAWLRRQGILQARPRVLGDCTTPGPCPYVSCRANLYLDVDADTGAVKLNFPDKEVWELEETCAHRVVATRGPLSLNETGKLLNITEEWVRQIELVYMRKLKRWAKGAARRGEAGHGRARHGEGMGNSKRENE